MTKEDCRHGLYLTSISVLREFVRRSGHTGTEELHMGIVSTADLRLHLVLKVAATAHTSVSSRSRRKCTASMQDLQYRQLVHPHRRTSLHLCAGISGNRQQLEVGAETPRRDSLDGDEGRSCLCNTADFQVTRTLCGFALLQQLLCTVNRCAQILERLRKEQIARVALDPKDAHAHVCTGVVRDQRA